MRRKPKNQQRKKLNRVDGSIFNQYGVEISEQEARNLKNLVDSANRKRRNMIKNEHALTEFFGGVSHKKTIGELSGKMGKESDFILAKKTRSLQRFQSYDEFKSYIGYLKDVVSKDYIPRRIKQYRENQIKAIRNVFNKKGDKIINDINSLTTEEYMKLVQSDEAAEIWYTYSPEEERSKLKALRKAVNRVKRKVK